MNESPIVFEFSKNVEHYLAALSKLYAYEGKSQKQEIIVNATVRINEGSTYDNWNGGTYGHALYLTIPETIYLSSAKNKESLQNEIRQDLNKIINIQDEFISEVLFEMGMADETDWRRESGLLQQGKQTVPIAGIKRIWGNSGYRVFLSHKTEVKKEVAILKNRLQLFGISCFVAHKDIKPTKVWQDEIENALQSMDAFIALMTDSFHDSDWTDQEVGFALGRGVPLIAVKFGRDPYGFIGKFQALTCDWDSATKGIVGLLIEHSRMLDAYIDAVKSCISFDNGNLLAEILPSITRLTDIQTEKLILAFNENSQVQASYGFNGTRPRLFGEGLAIHFKRITGREYIITSSGIRRDVK
jgi:hypothetical protein